MSSRYTCAVVPINRAKTVLTLRWKQLGASLRPKERYVYIQCPSEDENDVFSMLSGSNGI